MIYVLIAILTGVLPLYVIRFSIAGIPTNLFEVMVFGILCIALGNAGYRKQLVFSMNSISFVYKLWIALFSMAALLATFYSPILRSSLGIMKSWIVTPVVFGFLVYVAIGVRGRKDILYSFACSGLVVAIIGLSQIYNLERITAFYDVPNSLALFLVPITVLAMWVGIRGQDRFYGVNSMILAGAIIATQSFGAIAAVVGSLVIGLICSWRTLPFVGAKKMILGLLFVICSAGIVFFASGRLQYMLSPLIDSSLGNSVTVRFQLWDIGARLIQKNPILGVGLGQFEQAYQAELHQLFSKQEAGLWDGLYVLQHEFVFRDPHNWILSFYLNMGLLGLVSFLTLNAFSVASWGQAIKNGDIYQQASILAVVSMLLFGLVDTIYWKNDLSALWWAFFALTVFPATSRIPRT